MLPVRYSAWLGGGEWRFCAGVRVVKMPELCVSWRRKVTRRIVVVVVIVVVVMVVVVLVVMVDKYT